MCLLKKPQKFMMLCNLLICRHPRRCVMDSPSRAPRKTPDYEKMGLLISTKSLILILPPYRGHLTHDGSQRYSEAGAVGVRRFPRN